MLSNERFCARTDVETKPTHTKEVPMSADNKVIIRRLFEEVFNKRNIVTPQHAIRGEGFPKGRKYD